MHAKAGHGAVALGNAHIIKQESELQRQGEEKNEVTMQHDQGLSMEKVHGLVVALNIKQHMAYVGQRMHCCLPSLPPYHVSRFWMMRQEIHDAPRLLLCAQKAWRVHTQRMCDLQE